uniref:F-box domain-containing protein n=1 Tax=Setaria italica TaxID=4555 RepID=K3ZNI0_SETIT
MRRRRCRQLRLPPPRPRQPHDENLLAPPLNTTVLLQTYRRELRKVRSLSSDGFTAAPPPEAKTTLAPALPSDLVLEIVSRSDVATLLRCAACCKPLRRDILRPAFIRRVCHGPAAAVPPRLLCFLQSRDVFFRLVASRGFPPPPPFSLLHPATPAAAYLFEQHLAPFLSHGGADILARYEPVTSRGGLVVLRRRHDTDVPQESGICVYDPMTGGRAYSPYGGLCTYVLLTASDGIGCSFLLAADFKMLKLMHPTSSFKVLTVSPDAAAGSGKWSPVTSVTSHHRSHGSSPHPFCSAVVLGGSIHWVMHGGADHLHVLTYHVRTATAGSIELPMDSLPRSYRETNDSSLRRRRRRTGSSRC